MITMAETASAVCQTEGCFWSASGPNSANAAVGHDIEFGDHTIVLTSGLVVDRGWGMAGSPPPDWRENP